MNNEETTYLRWLNTTVNDYRGKFINQAIFVEQIIDEFLSYYFIPNSEDIRLQFHQLVLSSIDITFSQKINIFTKIADNFLPSKYEEYKQYLSKIEKLRHKRNEFAHSKIDARKESIKRNQSVRDKLFLLKLKDFQMKETILEIKILENQYSEFGELITKLAEMLNMYIKDVQKSQE